MLPLAAFVALLTDAQKIICRLQDMQVLSLFDKSTLRSGRGPRRATSATPTTCSTRATRNTAT